MYPPLGSSDINTNQLNKEPRRQLCIRFPKEEQWLLGFWKLLCPSFSQMALPHWPPAINISHLTALAEGVYPEGRGVCSLKITVLSNILAIST